MPPTTRGTQRRSRPATVTRRFDVQSTPRYRTRMASERRSVVTEPEPEPESTNAPQSSSSNSRPIRNYSPTRVGSNAGSSIGLLEAEYFGCVFLLILALFGSSGTYGSKIMSFMKRGVLVSILFFFLALASSAGPNAVKITKAIGGLVFVAMLISAPSVGFLEMLDKLFKANWISSGEHGTDVGSSNAGTSSGGLHAASGALQRITQIIESFGLGIIK